jgi:hypothetical protein
LKDSGGEGGIRTLDRAFKPYNGLANRRLQPLGHLSAADFNSLARSRNLPAARFAAFGFSVSKAVSRVFCGENRRMKCLDVTIFGYVWLRMTEDALNDLFIRAQFRRAMELFAIASLQHRDPQGWSLGLSRSLFTRVSASL